MLIVMGYKLSFGTSGMIYPHVVFVYLRDSRKTQ